MRRRRSFLILLAGVVAAWSIAASASGRFPGDLEVSTWLQRLDGAWLERLMEFGDFAGDIPFMGGVLAAALLILLLQRRLLDSAGLALAGFVYAAEPALKQLIARPRPDANLVRVLAEADGFGYPSGHTMAAVLVLGGLILFASAISGGSRGTAVALRAAALLLLVIVAVSRMYLGVHWTSDVIGALLIGGVALSAVTYVHRAVQKRLEAGSGRSSGARQPRESSPRLQRSLAGAARRQ